MSQSTLVARWSWRDPPSMEESIGRAGLRRGSPEIVAMDTAQCWARLITTNLGRVLITAHGRPHIFPVTYMAGESAIVFRTGPGTKLEHGPGTLSCFEIDGWDQMSHEGWSVMAFGRLEEITGAGDERSSLLRKLPVDPIAPGPRPHWIAMNVDEVTGRHFSGGWIVPGNFFG